MMDASAGLGQPPQGPCRFPGEGQEGPPDPGPAQGLPEVFGDAGADAFDVVVDAVRINRPGFDPSVGFFGEVGGDIHVGADQLDVQAEGQFRGPVRDRQGLAWHHAHQHRSGDLPRDVGDGSGDGPGLVVGLIHGRS